MLENIEDVGYVEFPPQMSDSEQWTALERCLEDEDLRTGRFERNVVKLMRRRETVNIKEIAAQVAEKLGDQYGVWAEEVMLAAVEKTRIQVV